MDINYNHLNTFLKQKFGERVLKICIDGGFTCPNRDGTKGTGGCIFCSERGSGDHIAETQIKKQIEFHLNSYRGERAKKFIAYFQNFTNTYDNLENLKRKYDCIKSYPNIVALAVATRPDCITEEIANLLSSYTQNYYVYVELGLQTSNDETRNFLNCGYTKSNFISAVEVLNKYNIDVVAHIMLGLPNRTQTELENTINFLNTQNISGLKIHSTYVIKNTKLEELYLNNLYTPQTLEEYINEVCFVIAHIKPNVIIHRVSGDAPKNLLTAPMWNAHKKWIINGIEKALKEKNITQGCEYKIIRK